MMLYFAHINAANADLNDERYCEMDLIKMLRDDRALSDLLSDVCDVEILPEFREPQDEDGHLTYNIPGKTFARAGS